MIRTARLVLRPPRASDLDALHAIFSDPEAMRYWSTLPHSHAETRAFLDAMLAADPADSLETVIERDGAVIGRAALWRRPEIGYLLHRDHWGQGLGGEAIGALVAAIWDRFPDLDHIVAEIDPRNVASDRLLRRLGFQETGRAERTLQLGDEWCDSVYFRLDRSPA